MVVIAKEITHYCGIALFRQRRCKRKITSTLVFRHMQSKGKSDDLGRNLIQEHWKKKE